MDRKYKVTITILRVFTIIIAIYILFSTNMDKGLISFEFALRFRQHIPYYPSRGILSTGIPYEFRGIFDFFEYRQQYQYYWERAVGDSIITHSPIEVAEVGQFYLFPNLNAQHARWVIAQGWFIVIHYCPRTDDWVMKWQFCEEEILARRWMPTPIFTINRTDGTIIEYGNNLTGQFVSEFTLRRRGWRRTIDNRTLLQRIFDVLHIQKILSHL